MNYKRWDWVVRSYECGRRMMETVHKGTISRDLEIEAARHCGRVVHVFGVKDGQAWPWKHFGNE